MKKVLRQLRVNLKHGEIAKVCEITGYSWPTVSKTLNGQIQKPKISIIEAALQVVADRQKATLQLEEQIKNMIGSIK